MPARKLAKEPNRLAQGKKSPSLKPGSSPSRRLTLVAALVLVFLPCIAYLPLLQAGMIWDDDAYVTNNSTLRNLEGLGRIWFEPRSIPQYYPLVHTTFWLEYQLWGLHPTGYHIVNVLLHAASCLLLWRLLLHLEVSGAWLAAAVFAVHPVMVESVAWITERKNVLSLLLALASMQCYVFYEQSRAVAEVNFRRSIAFYLVSLCLFLAALFSKTVVCTLPAVIMVIVWWKSGTIPWKLAVRLTPFFILGIGLGLTTVWLEKHHVGAQGAEWALSFLDRILLANRIIWFYVGKILWPEPLIFFYPRWSIDSRQVWQYIFPIATFGVVGFLWLGRRRFGRGPLAAALIFAGVLFPALGLFDVYPFRYSYVADHFQYHASIALIVLLVALGERLTHLLGTHSSSFRQGLAVSILLALCFLTLRHTQNFYNVETIFVDTLRKNPTAWGAASNLVKLYLNDGRLDEAMQVARLGVAQSPQIADVHNAMGGVLLKSGTNSQVDAALLNEAVNCFLTTIRIQPNYTEAYFNLTTTLNLLGRQAESIEYYRRLLELVPDDVEAMVGLAQALVTVGESEEAAELLTLALRADPHHASAITTLATLKIQSGQWDDAIALCLSALRIDGDLTEARMELAAAYAAKEDFHSAKIQYDIVVQVQPWNARARNNLGVVLMNLGQAQLATEQFMQALQVAPDYQQAKDNLEKARQSSSTP